MQSKNGAANEMARWMIKIPISLKNEIFFLKDRASLWKMI